MHPPAGTDTWVALTTAPLPMGAVADWAVRPSCGAVVLFSGTVRDNSAGRPDVRQLVYEAYDEQVEPQLAAIADEARVIWPTVGRLALLHRVGELDVGETSVVIVASAPHRPEAFEAARWCIDALKERVPIWKREIWEGGTDWGLCAHDVAGDVSV